MTSKIYSRFTNKICFFKRSKCFVCCVVLKIQLTVDMLSNFQNYVLELVDF